MSAAARWFADRAWHGAARILGHERLATDTYRLRLECPQLARRITPGQFVMLRAAGLNDPLLGRPLALYDTILDEAGAPRGIEVVYFVLGKLTSLLAKRGDLGAVELWGPLGNGFPAADGRPLILVAGGIGQTPFPALAREALGLRQYGDPPRAAEIAPHVTLCYGARRVDLLAGFDDFRELGIDVRVSTDDGSAGRRGFVTELLREALGERPEARVLCCGPEPMMAAVARLCAERGAPCLLSLETPMACGIGICFSCVARVRDEQGGWDYRRTCVEGPVFDAASVLL